MSRGCDFGGCERPHYGLGYCKLHHRQYRKGKQLKPPTGKAIPIEKRFWEKVEYDDVTGCLLWTGGTNGGTNHGRFRLNGMKIQAYRFAWEITGNSIPDEGWWHPVENPTGLQLDHDNPDYGCGNPRCVNPAHLEPVTAKTNARRKRSTKAASGVRNVSVTPSGKFVVQVGCDYGKHYGGTYEALTDAEQAAIGLRNSLFTNNETDRRAS